MSNKSNKGNHEALLHHLGAASKNMVLHHHRDNLSEFVLHDLCVPQGFNMRKAAYLVNNPDFTCLKGVAGFFYPETFYETMWQSPNDFTSHMQRSPYNQRVRSLMQESLPLGQKGFSKESLRTIVDYLEIQDAAYHTWQSKHNNQGLLIFEKPYEESSATPHLHDFLHMLSFCPVF